MRLRNRCSLKVVLAMYAMVAASVIVSYNMLSQTPISYSWILWRHFITGSKSSDSKNESSHASRDGYRIGRSIDTMHPAPPSSRPSTDVDYSIQSTFGMQAAEPSISGLQPVEKTANETKSESSLDVNSNSSKNSSAVNGTKYLIYLCNKDVYCFGFGDRQRGMVAAYVLAVLTQRQFGINMTYPWPLQDFYKPQIVQWDIPEKELLGKSWRIIHYFKTQAKELMHINFNQAYPEDIIFVRTNLDLWKHLRKNPFYKGRFPPWSFGRRNRIFANGWEKLMTPTAELRSDLNVVLANIARSMMSSSAQETNSSNAAAINGTLAASVNPGMGPDQLSALAGYGLADLNLTCAHVRVGHSETMPRERRVKNDIDSVGAVWKFLKPHIQRGLHVYLATDSNQVRSKAKVLYGDRIHFVDGAVVHVGSVLKDQDPREGLKTALLEQLLLMTSCKVLLVSHSSYSLMAAYLRMKLTGVADNYMFDKGKVSPWRLWTYVARS